MQWPDWRRVALGLAVAVPALVGATAVVGLLQDGLGLPNPSAVYLLAVIAVALVGGPLEAALTAIAAALLYDFLFTEPRYTLVIGDANVWLSVVLLLFVGVLVGQLAALQRSRTEIAQAREREARALFRISRALATRDSTLAVLAEIIEAVRDEARMTRVWVGLGPDDAGERVMADTVSDGPPVAPAMVNVLRRMPGDEPARWFRVHQPGQRRRLGGRLDGYRVRIEAGGVGVGWIRATRDGALGQPDATETRLLAATADQLGQALAQDAMAAQAQAAEIARQSDELKSALLQSVSHDLRTPLATIRAAAGTLQSGSGLTADDRRQSAEAIEREVEYLNRLVTNLLDLSRIEAGALRADDDVFELNDLVGSTLDRLAPRLGGRPLEVELDAPPVRADATFVAQAVTNVLENAIKYTPPGTALRVRADDRGATVRLTIEDGGPGVPVEALPRLFDKFYRVPGRDRNSRLGTGIGLAVTRGLVETMGGTVGARTSDLGGLAIDLDLLTAFVPAAAVATVS